MKTKELEQLSDAALLATIADLRTQYFAARADVRSGKEQNSAALKGLRRQIARASTALEARKRAAAVNAFAK